MDNRELFQKDDGEQLLARLTHLGNTYERLGYIHQAAATHIHRLAIYQRRANRAEEARVLVQLGMNYDMLGNVNEAIEACEQSLAIARQLGARQVESMARVALGSVYGHLGYAGRTLAEGLQGLRIARELDDRQGEQAALQSIGQACLWLDEIEMALPFYFQALQLAHERGDSYEIGTLLEHIGLAYQAQGDAARAIEYYNESIHRLTLINTLFCKGRVFAHLGHAYTTINQLDGAEVALSQARLFFDEVHMYRGSLLLAFYMAGFYRRQRRFEDAQQSYQRAITLCDDVQDRYGQAQCLLAYARLLREYQQEQEAVKMASTALTIYRERGTEKQVAKVQKWMGKIIQE